MPRIDVRPLRDELPFGKRVTGATHETLADESVRADLNEMFEQHGFIVFEGVEQSSAMHLAISNVFGLLKDHPVPSVDRVDQDAMPGVIDIYDDAETSAIVEIDGVERATWLPWHFDHAYNNELNRAGVLRARILVPEGGMTGFVDGIELFNTLTPDLREALADCEVLYTLNLAYDQMRFGVPERFRLIRPHAKIEETVAFSKTLPRAVHPAIWERSDGQKVLHVSPWGAVGVKDHEDPEGDALLERVCQEINRLAREQAYFHKWRLDDMVIWDNWRLLHSVSGHTPGQSRQMQRTTIKGDYGLGYFENGGPGDKRLEMTV